MGNFLGKILEQTPRRSEIQPDFFSLHFNTAQYPRNLNFPFDGEHYSISSKDSGKLFTLKRFTFLSREAMDSYINVLEHAADKTHDNILKIESYFIEPNCTKDGVVSHSVNIIMEHFTHTLRDELIIRKNENKPFSERNIRSLLSQMVEALDVLHSSNFCYGSLNPSNIYVTADGQYKLCFVGEPFYKTEVGINPAMLNMLEYMSPKQRLNLSSILINGNFNCKIMFDKFKADIFGLGLVVLQMLSLKDIMNLNITGGEVARYYLYQECKRYLVPRLADILELMIRENETKIPTCYDIKATVNILQDEDSEIDAMNAIERRQTLEMIRQSETKKKNQNIEMKIIEDRSGDQVHVNYPFDISISEDYIDSANTRYYGRKSPYNYGFESPISHNVSQNEYYINGDVNELSKSTTSISDEYVHSRRNEDRQNGEMKCITPTRTHKNSDNNIYINDNEEDDGQELEFAVDEMVISYEEDLLKPISPCIKKLIIRLGGQPQHQDISKVIADFLFQQKSLQELVLTLPNMSLGDQGIVTIAQSIATLDELKVLFIELRKNKIGSQGVQALGAMFKNKKHLVQLGIDLAGNSLNKDLCKELAMAFEGLEGLKSLALNIGANQIQSDGLDEISRLVSRPKLLENLVLFLYSNEIENAKSINLLTESIDGLENLKSFSIDLSDNLIGDEAAKDILNFLKESSVKGISVELLNNCMSENTRIKMEKEIMSNSGIKLKI